MQPPTTAGVYVHIPFCAKKCGYCDFNAYSGYKADTMRRYVDALCREIRARGDQSVAVPTIFFGGGTPTLLPGDALAHILQTVRESFTVATDAEISTEANPGDASAGLFAVLLNAGFNRLSFGVQTFDDRLLKTIDRIHTGQQAKEAVGLARAVGFANLSIDLMFALPRQTVSDWERSLEAAFALDVPHLSMYALIVEEGTAFFARRERGKLSLPGEDTEAAMFARAIVAATNAGYEHYEVSNYARPGFRCRHNQVYWRNEPYYGFGAGAASYLHGARMMNEKNPARYLATVTAGGTAVDCEERLNERETMGETLMVGLRMRDGVEQARFVRRFGLPIEGAFPEVVATYLNNGLLEWANANTDAARLRLTERGLFLASDVMAAFLP